MGTERVLTGSNKVVEDLEMEYCLFIYLHVKLKGKYGSRNININIEKDNCGYSIA